MNPASTVRPAGLISDDTANRLSVGADGGLFAAGVNISPINLSASNLTLGATDYALVSDSSGGARTVTLPASPSQGRTYRVKRIGANAVTIARNGQNINGAASNLSLTTNGQSVDLIFSVGDGWYTF